MHGNYQVIYQNTKYPDGLDLTKFLRCKFINAKVMQIFDVMSARFLCDIFLDVQFETYHTASN